MSLVGSAVALFQVMLEREAGVMYVFCLSKTVDNL
jgi:hypothetical protein